MSSSKSAPAAFLQQLIHENGVRRILARVTPNQPRFLVAECRLENVDGQSVALVKLKLTSPPEEGKANKELLKELAAVLQMELTLLSGQQSRVKTLQITSLDT